MPLNLIKSLKRCILLIHQMNLKVNFNGIKRDFSKSSLSTSDILQPSFSQDFDSELKLRRVRIYFYATTFDRITKDRAAKFVDMLSAVGGTMGLLTGFSIISAVEIVYFGIKIILKILNDRVNINK